MLRKQVFYLVGVSITILGFSMLISALWSFFLNEDAFWGILKSSFISVIAGITISIASYAQKQANDLTIRDGFAIVTIGWISIAIFSALPMYFSTDISYTDCFFEAMSGLTTTGATILDQNRTIAIESLSKGILFWRSFTQFIGGMGIIVFSIAVLPMLGIGGVQLFRAEVAGPSADKLTPRVKQTAKLLWGIYLGFTIILCLILRVEGMSWFDSLCHAFTTIATSGFSTKSGSIGEFSGLIQWTIIIFMFISASNFSLHYYFISKGKFNYFKECYNPQI